MAMTSDMTRFLIAGTQRTGTTLLRTSLNSHEDVACHGEVFKLGRSPYALPDGYWAFTRSSLRRRVASIAAPQRSIGDFLDRLYSQPGYRAIGFKLMLSHCRARRDLWSLVVRHEPKVVLMVRDNHLKTLVSRRAAAASGVYHVSKSLPVKTAVKSWTMKPVTLDPSTLIHDLDAIASESRDWRDLVSGLERIEVRYETYTLDQRSENLRLMRFLGLPEKQLTSDLKKVTSDRLEDAIANFSEVETIVRASRYADCIEPRS